MQNYRWHHCVGKVPLVSSNSRQEKIGHVIDEDDEANVLIVETRDANDMMVTLEVRAPELNFQSKERACGDDNSCPGHKLVLFEPIVLAFNVKDCTIKFWFFSNRCTTTHKHTAGALNRIKFYDNHCSIDFYIVKATGLVVQTIDFSCC